MGVWIETSELSRSSQISGVTPFVGVWIETHIPSYAHLRKPVTPFVGVWIETRCRLRPCRLAVSHPSWVCGLKLVLQVLCVNGTLVTPFVGVWIETNLRRHRHGRHRRHTLRGCVD